MNVVGFSVNHPTHWHTSQLPLNTENVSLQVKCYNFVWIHYTFEQSAISKCLLQRFFNHSDNNFSCKLDTAMTWQVKMLNMKQKTSRQHLQWLTEIGWKHNNAWNAGEDVPQVSQESAEERHNFAVGNMKRTFNCLSIDILRQKAIRNRVKHR